MQYNLLLILLVVISVSLIALILIQHGKGADAGAAFGSGASGTVFGSKGATSFLGKLTSGLAVAFFIVCILLAYLIGHQHRSASGNSGSIVDQLEDAPNVPAIPDSEANVPEIPVSPTEAKPADIPQVQEVAPTVEPEAAVIPDVPVTDGVETAPEINDEAGLNDDVMEAVSEESSSDVMDKAGDAMPEVVEPVTDEVDSAIDSIQQIVPESPSIIEEAAEEQIQNTN